MLVKRVVRAMLPRSIRNVVRAPRSTLRWVEYALRHAAGMDEDKEIRPGFRLRCHPAAFPLAYHYQFDDAEQSAEFDSFIAECTPGMHLLDIGAHFGLFSLAAIHYGGARARAVAVDASPTAIAMVRRQIALNGVENRVTCVTAAAGAQVGWMEMLSTGPQGAGYFLPSRGDHGASDMTRTPVTTIDSLAQEYGSFSHIKIDVESWEADVLRGGVATFTGANQPKLFLEVHTAMVCERGARAEDALDLLAQYGYETYDLSGSPRTRASILNAEITRILCLPRGAVPAVP